MVATKQVKHSWRGSPSTRDLLYTMTKTRKPSWSNMRPWSLELFVEVFIQRTYTHCCRASPLQCVYTTVWRPRQIILSSFDATWPHITYRLRHTFCILKEAENRHFRRYSDAKTTVYPFKVIQGYWFWYEKHEHTFLLVINNNFSHILHRFGDMAA